MTHALGEQTRRFARIAAAAWANPAFERWLLADPVAALQEHGIQFAVGAQIRMLEDTAQLVHLVLPSRPDELSGEQLGGIAGGSGKSPWPPPPPPPPGSARAGRLATSSMEL